MPLNPDHTDNQTTQLPAVPENVAPDRQALARLESFANLDPNWNSYSAAPPALAAIDNAKMLVVAAGKLEMMPERVEPSAMGGVGVTFATQDREVVVEFYNNGTAHALFANDARAEMHTQTVRTDEAGYQRLIGEVHTYLHGE